MMAAYGAAVVLALSSTQPQAQVAPPPPPGVTGINVGLLNCNLSTIGLILGSLQTMECRFAPSGPFPPEIYRGTFGTLGIDVGVTLAQGLAWQVYAPTAADNCAIEQRSGGGGVRPETNSAQLTRAATRVCSIIGSPGSPPR